MTVTRRKCARLVHYQWPSVGAHVNPSTSKRQSLTISTVPATCTSHPHRHAHNHVLVGSRTALQNVNGDVALVFIARSKSELSARGR